MANIRRKAIYPVGLVADLDASEDLPCDASGRRSIVHRNDCDQLIFEDNHKQEGYSA